MEKIKNPGELAEQLRKSQEFVPITHMAGHIHIYHQSQGINHSFLISADPGCVYCIDIPAAKNLYYHSHKNFKNQKFVRDTKNRG